MQAVVTGTVGLASTVETIKADFWNLTGGTLTLGAVALVDIFGSSSGVVVGANYELQTSRFARVVGTSAFGTDTAAVRRGWYVCLLEDSLAAGAKGSFLMQGYADRGVQARVAAADVTTSSISTASPHYIYSLDVGSANANRCALRDFQSGADVQRRGCFMPDTFVAGDTDMLLKGLFLGKPSDHFGFAHA